MPSGLGIRKPNKEENEACGNIFHISKIFMVKWEPLANAISIHLALKANVSSVATHTCLPQWKRSCRQGMASGCDLQSFTWEDLRQVCSNVRHQDYEILSFCYPQQQNPWQSAPKERGQQEWKNQPGFTVCLLTWTITIFLVHPV